MSYNLSVHLEALLDIQEAFEWYEIQQSSLEYEFIGEVEETYKKICDHPFTSPKRNTPARKLVYCI